VLRSLYLAELALFSSQTFQSLDMITQETAILVQMRSAEPSGQIRIEDGRQAARGSTPAYSERLDGPKTLPGLGGKGPLLDKSGKPLQPFTLTEKRTQLKDGVFRPGHSLPTMSIDEYLEEEKRRGGILDSDNGANGRAVEFDEDNDAHADAATMKAREWDEFVEANPKGAGNTINRG
jgi:immunoglobulin-binding protein 1